MEFVVFQAYFLFGFGIVIDVIIIIVNFYVLYLLLKNSFKFKSLPSWRKLLKINNRVKDASIAGSNNRDDSNAADLVTNANTTVTGKVSVLKATQATNAFLVSLCVSNLLVGTLVLPIFAITKYNGDYWSLELCRAYRYFKYFAIMANLYTNVSIAIERFRCVIYKTKYNKRAILINIFVFYAIAFAVAFVEVYRYEVELEEHTITLVNKLGKVCELPHEAEYSERLAYALVFFIVIVLIPLFGLIALYGIVLHRLRIMEGKLNQINGAAAVATAATNQSSKFKLFLQSFIILLVILFVCFLPYAILTVIEGLFDVDKDIILQFVLDLTLILSTSHAFLTLLPYRFLLPKNLVPCS